MAFEFIATIAFAIVALIAGFSFALAVHYSAIIKEQRQTINALQDRIARHVFGQEAEDWQELFEQII